jgi:hypothetical protein
MRRRETHCLDWRWNDKCKTTESRREWCRQFYYADDLQLHPSLCLRFYAELSFGQSARHPPIARSVQLEDEVHCHAAKSSAESHYAMVTSTEGTEAQLRTRGQSGEKSRFASHHGRFRQDARVWINPILEYYRRYLDDEILCLLSEAKRGPGLGSVSAGHSLNTGSYCLWVEDS